MTRFALKFTGYLLLLLCALWCLDRAVVGQTHWPRFHRYALTRLDDTTTLDMVKDSVRPNVCRLVYRVRETHRGPVNATSIHYDTYPVIAVTYLGEVPCDPAPVPPKVGDAPAASVVR